MLGRLLPSVCGVIVLMILCGMLAAATWDQAHEKVTQLSLRSSANGTANSSGVST